jgi:ERCC4-related helicase
MAPTVALCLQQYKVISQHIPAAKSRTLTGLDKVELWTEQPTWDAVLQDVQVVISTHAVLVDAMTHGFVRISQLGLIIFDEGRLVLGRVV